MKTKNDKKYTIWIREKKEVSKEAYEQYYLELIRFNEDEVEVENKRHERKIAKLQKRIEELKGKLKNPKQ